MKPLLTAAFLALCLCLGMAGSPPALAQVTEASLTAEGTGLTRDEAIQSALVNAAGQAFGVDLSAATQSLSTATDVHADDESHSLMVSSLNKNVQQVLRTPGNAPILGYTVDHAMALPDAGWEATVTLRYAHFERMGADTDRRSIVVVGNHRQYGRMLRETVGESLVGTRRFDVLNRANNQFFEDEKEFILSSDAATAEMARLSQAGGADYLVIVDLPSLGISNNNRETIRMTGEVLVKSSVSGTLRLQIVEFASRKVKWSGTQKFGGTYPDVASIGAGTLTRLINDASNILIEKMVAGIYPIRVVKVMGDTAIVNRGEGGVVAGETYAVFLEGEELIDPQSGESLGSMEVEVGLGRITDVKPKFSFLKMATGTLEANASYIVRKSTKKPAAAPGSRRPASAAPRKPAEPSRKDAFLNN
ncbi:MAG TPA: hypothetical protein VL003_05365 [Pusillimonas sp.]|uniref:hypothetical protein n=1 Tax=Pusillimonas sp. TaxID=3040095 RepID=UPI002C3A0866|nr:hypothetical protein [Pusillimonas sp.]HUH87465.1 hypothetical protein [Pusillimonas sp.]